ncbi:MAG TPA: hypothetical protein VM840_11525 [Actinomycetota bacterium]|nr:hypothetical protein [Actinomycetota bacterium]
MRSIVKAVALVVSGIVLGSAVSVAAQDGSAERPPGREGRPWVHKGGPFGALRSESVVPDRDGEGFVTVRADRGELTDVDGQHLTIREDDGHVVRVAVAEDTAIRRDGSQAGVGDLKVGDRVHTMRTETEAGFVTRSVHAVSPGRWAEMEKRREACQQDRTRCRRGGRGHGEKDRVERAPAPSSDTDGSVEPAPAPAHVAL